MKIEYVFICLVYLMGIDIAYISNILGPLIPQAQSTFNLSLTKTGFLPFIFFIAYGVFSIPSGYFSERFGSKATIITAFTISTIGSLCFIIKTTYLSYVISLFIIGAGLSMLQVVTGPLLLLSSGIKHYPFFAILSQLIFGIASFISPYIYSFIIAKYTILNSTQKNISWVYIYWLNIIFSFLIIFFTLQLKFPKNPSIASTKVIIQLLKNKLVYLYFFATFSYVGIEIGISAWISKYINLYYAGDIVNIGSHAVAYFWGAMAFGGIFGLWLVKIINIRVLLVVYIICEILSLSLGLFSNSLLIATIGFSLCGFFLAVVYPNIYTLALSSIKSHHNSFNGIICSSISGGAIVPWLIGYIGDIWNLKAGMCINYILAFYILFAATKSSNSILLQSRKSEKV